MYKIFTELPQAASPSFKFIFCLKSYYMGFRTIFSALYYVTHKVEYTHIACDTNDQNIKYV